jgi:hypothetical protein
MGRQVFSFNHPGKATTRIRGRLELEFPPTVISSLSISYTVDSMNSASHTTKDYLSRGDCTVFSNHGKGCKLNRLN